MVKTASKGLPENDVFNAGKVMWKLFYWLIFLIGVVVATRTLVFTPGPSVVREAITETTGAGFNGFSHLFDPAPRPLYKFSLQVGPIIKSEAECLSALHAFHQGNKAFFYNGGMYGSKSDFVTVGEGDGVRTQYLLPNRYIGGYSGASSLALRTYRPSTSTNSTWTTWSLHPQLGLVVLDSSPQSGDLLQAKYSNFYRVNFSPDGFKLDQVAKDLYIAEFDLLENPNIVGDLPADDHNIGLTKVSLNARTRLSAVNSPFTLRASRRQSLSATTKLTGVTRTTARPVRLSVAAKISGIANLTWASNLFTQYFKTLDAQVTLEPRFDYGDIARGRLQVGSGATTGVVSFTGFTGVSSAYFTAVPDWNTTVWVTSRDNASVSLGFGTQIGSGGGYVDWGLLL